MVKKDDFECMKELLDSFIQYRAGTVDAHGRLEPSTYRLAGLGIMLTNLTQQAKSILTIAQNARRDTELEKSAEHCEIVINKLARLYDAAEKQAAQNNFTDRKTLEHFMKNLLKEMDKVAEQIRNLTNHYMAQRDYILAKN